MISTSPIGRRTVLADTGSLVAATDPKDPYHARARQDIQRLARERRPVAILQPILLECYSLIVHRLGAHAAVSWLADVRIKGIIVAPRADDFVAAMDRPARYAGQPITLFDASLAAMSDPLGLPVWTFDHHFDVMRVAVWR